MFIGFFENELNNQNQASLFYLQHIKLQDPNIH